MFIIYFKSFHHRIKKYINTNLYINNLQPYESTTNQIVRKIYNCQRTPKRFELIKKKKKFNYTLR